jgi:hypothetical protein
LEAQFDALFEDPLEDLFSLYEAEMNMQAKPDFRLLFLVTMRVLIRDSLNILSLR